MVLRPPKAFLCYSRTDHEFVSKVASDLGRQFCLYDEFVIQVGDDLKQAIRRGLDEASLFVLFASRDSLTSKWTTFEMEEADLRRARGIIARGLVLRLDTTIRVDELPPWLQQAKFGDGLSSKAAARLIHGDLIEMTRRFRESFFVGRTEELRQIQAALLPVDGTPPPRILLIGGLDGVGRRTVVAEVSKDLLHLGRILPVSLEEGDSAQDLAFKIADLIEPRSTTEALKALATEMASLSVDEANKRSATDLQVACSTGEMPVLLHEGGTLDSSGSLHPFLVNLLNRVSSQSDTYLTLIVNRRPKSEEIPGVGVIPWIPVPPLKLDEVKMLLSALARSEKLPLSPEQLTQMAERIRGWPPAAYFAVQFAKQYGVGVLLADNLRIAELSVAPFRKYLHSLGLGSPEVKVVRALAAHSPLPLSVLAEIAHLNTVEITSLVCRLIDLGVTTVWHPSGTSRERVRNRNKDGAHCPPRGMCPVSPAAPVALSAPGSGGPAGFALSDRVRRLP